ncbi:MAG TPA: ABC transporter ATP-binding protein [Candidatus Hydrogenedentes bacterium]|nr:ABC transporter ATP-binding protein [Candidatus Hydrogenedentota bacterium]
MTLLRLENVVQRHSARRGKGAIEALRVHDLDVKRGEVVSVVGPNGSGKSTLAETLAFMVRPSDGRVLLDGADPWAEGRALWARRRCPILLQETTLFSTSVLNNAAKGLRIRGVSRSDALVRARGALAQVKVEHLAERHAHQLSGGEQRRVALARLLALESDLLVLDEPMAGLDRESEEVMAQLVHTLHKDRGVTLVMATHNLRRAVALSTRIVTLVDGKLIPAMLDNLFFGFMRRTEAGFLFEQDGGWQHVFARSDLAEDRWEGVGPLEGGVQVGIPAGAFRVEPAGQGGSVFAGTVEAIRKERDAYRLHVCVGDGPVLRVDLALHTWAQTALTIGQRVELTLRAGSTLIMPMRQAPARACQSRGA